MISRSSSLAGLCRSILLRRLRASVRLWEQEPALAEDLKGGDFAPAEDDFLALAEDDSAGMGLAAS